MNSMNFKCSFKSILVVVKQTPFEFYTQLKSQGKAPVALRWERLRNRYMKHRACVDKVVSVLDSLGCNYNLIGREELHRGMIADKDLVIAVGGDGTILNTSSFLDHSIPILGINSDPTSLSEKAVVAACDGRRSRGALAGTSLHTVDEDLPRVLLGNINYSERSRIRCFVRSAYTETRLPPALNDLLLTSPSPADVSRFRLAKCDGKVTASYSPIYEPEEIFSLNVWSSGLWVSSATGSTAAMHSAGGVPMDMSSGDLQYRVREHLVEQGQDHTAGMGHGMISPEEMMLLRWNSRDGAVFVDGSHFSHPLQLGDQIKVDAAAPLLKIYDTKALMDSA